MRADLDALPVRERTHLPFGSVTDGVCHACGHDLHTAGLVGALLALQANEAGLLERGIGVRAIFQAAEELIPGGAHDAIVHGAVDDVDVIFAVHADPSLDVGQVGLREGPLTAASDHLRVFLHGKGGHTSRPQLTQDLTYALAKVVTEVPAVLSRRLDPRAGASLVWGTIHAGKAANVIPSSGECSGTLRMLDAHAWLTIGPLLEEIVQSVVAPYAVQARLERVKGVPPVVNQVDAVEALRQATLAVGLAPVGTAQSLGGEDFSWYLANAPGAMARLGTRTPGGPTFDLHQGDLVVDDDAVLAGARCSPLSSSPTGSRSMPTRPWCPRRTCERDSPGRLGGPARCRRGHARPCLRPVLPLPRRGGRPRRRRPGRLGCNVENAAYGVGALRRVRHGEPAPRDGRRPARRRRGASTARARRSCHAGGAASCSGRTAGRTACSMTPQGVLPMSEVLPQAFGPGQPRLNAGATAGSRERQADL